LGKNYLVFIYGEEKQKRNLGKERKMLKEMLCEGVRD
jgi:hypothetical protein